MTPLIQSPLTEPFPPLSDLIMSKYASGVFENPPKNFLPSDYLTELLTRAILIEEIDPDWDGDDADFNGLEVVDFILERAQIVCATAVIGGVTGTDLYKSMQRFKACNFTDDSLPLKKEESEILKCFQLPTSLRRGRPEKYWTNLRTYNFLSNQFTFLAPVFTKSKFQIKLEPEHIFPFIEKSTEAREGTFSHVYRVQIHDAHQGDLNLSAEGTKANVAIKEIKDRRQNGETPQACQDRLDREWETEVQALDDLSGLKHDHIIQRIAAIERGSNRYLMFQWADGGSLRDFWESLPEPNLDPTFVKEIIGQVRGLADALTELHSYGGGSYRHGDLKPENILRLKDHTRVGVLKIADMGLAKRHFFDTQLRPETSTRYGTLVYQPPEVYTDNLKRPIEGKSGKGRSRLYDIWSVGCITLELIIWLVFGYKKLQNFNNNIKGPMEEPSAYYTFNEVGVGSGIATVHPNVRAFMEYMSEDSRCSTGTALGDLLKIVKTRLLVVPLPSYTPTTNLANIEEENNNVSVTAPIEADTLAPSIDSEPPGPTRGRAKDFLKLVNDIISKGEENSKYWFSGSVQKDRKMPLLASPLMQSRLTPDAPPRGNTKLDGKIEKLPVGGGGLAVPTEVSRGNKV